MDWLYPAFTQPHLLEAHGSPSFALPSTQIMHPMPPTPAMSQQAQFIAPLHSPPSTGDSTVAGHLMNVLADPSNLAPPPDNVGTPDARPARNRRNAESQRLYRERKKRHEQQLQAKVTELEAENARLKAKNKGLLTFLRSRYSHDPAFDLELISLGISEDIVLGGTGPPITTPSDHYGPPNIPSNTTQLTLPTFGVDPHVYQATTADTSSNPTQRLVYESAAYPPYCPMHPQTNFNFPSELELLETSVDINESGIQHLPLFELGDTRFAAPRDDSQPSCPRL